MKKYLVEIEVDESALLQYGDDEDGLSTETLIESEFSWLCQSGIFLQNIKPIES